MVSHQPIALSAKKLPLSLDASNPTTSGISLADDPVAILACEEYGCPDCSHARSRMSRQAAEEKFNALLSEYGRVLRAAIARTCSRATDLDLEAIEQEARLRLWRAIESEREIKEPASYLYKVAVSAALDALRYERRRQRAPLLESESTPKNIEQRLKVEDQSPQPDIELSRRQILDSVLTVVMHLPENRRRAVSLHLRGFTLQETGRLLGWSEAKVRNLVYRGMEQLRERLRDLGIEYESES